MVGTLEADLLRTEGPASLEALEHLAEGSSSQLLYLQVPDPFWGNGSLLPLEQLSYVLSVGESCSGQCWPPQIFNTQAS